jgi:hypothetical protein
MPRLVSLKLVSAVLLLSLCLSQTVMVIPSVGGTSDYEDQPDEYDSTLPTIIPKKKITDEDLADMVTTYIDSNYKDMVFVFGQCFGGGFIDDLGSATSGYNPVAIMSACKHNKLSFGSGSTSGRSYFLKAFSMYLHMYPTWPIKDLFYVGAVKSDEAAKKGWETPQFLSQPQPAGDNIKIHDGTSNYAILYAGRPNIDFLGGPTWTYWNDLDDIYDRLGDLGYTDNDIFVLYGDKKTPDGIPPSWPPIDYEATYDNLKTVFETLQAKMSPSATLFFWVSDHGDLEEKLLCGPVSIPPGQTLLCSFNMTSDFINALLKSTEPPYVSLLCDGEPNINNPVYLNGYFIGSIVSGSYCLEFDPTTIPLYESGNEIMIQSMSERYDLLVSDIKICANIVPQEQLDLGGVGGIVVPVDKFGLLAPYIGLASTILVATAATAIYVKRVKHRKEKQ